MSLLDMCTYTLYCDHCYTYEEDSLSICDNNDSSELDDIDIDTILSEDDPPKDLYLRSNIDDDGITIDDEEVLVQLLYIEFLDNLFNDGFDLYKHYGIPEDLSDAEREGMLEAAHGSS